MTYLLVFVVLALIVWRDVLAYKERQDLLNRIMARDYAEYERTGAVMPTALHLNDADEYHQELNSR